ncbi:MAG: DUF1292 domain-containing protein [Clostridiales bacterium]
MMDELITWIDEEGLEHQFTVEAFLDLDEEKYAVLIPMREDYDTDEAIIMRFGKDENGDEVLFDIESDAEWEKVADAYDEIIEDAEDELKN